MPEFTAPALGNKPNLVTIDADIPPNANGVLYKLGANSAGLTLFVENGILCYEYNLFLIMRTKIRATEQLPVGNARIEVETVTLSRSRRARCASRSASTASLSRPVWFRSAPLCSSQRTTASTSASP